MLKNLEYLRQDFFRVRPSDGIAVQVINTVSTIGGLTRGLCTKFPGLEDLITAEPGKFLPMGGVLVYDEPNLLLAAVVAQVFPGAATVADTYEARRTAFYSGLEYICKENPGRTIFVPYMICCGQAGDDWLLIEAMLMNLPNPVKVCVPNWAEDAAQMLGRLAMLKPPSVSEMLTDEAHAPLQSYKIAA